MLNTGAAERDCTVSDGSKDDHDARVSPYVLKHRIQAQAWPRSTRGRTKVRSVRKWEKLD